MSTLRSSQAPKSPWQRLLVRSRSLERMSSDENDDKKNVSRSQKQGWGWLVTPPSRFVRNPLQRSVSPTRSGLLSAAPSNLTMFLLRLNENLAQYCLYLSDPSLANARAAAEILDASSSSSSSSSPPTSPKSFFRHSSLQGEWDTYTSPLLLLTGAEALYGQMELTPQLQQLYQTIQTELTVVRERLCDPWLSAPPSRSQQAATSMALVLTGLDAFLTIRCQLVVLQMRLFSEGSSLLLLQACRELLPTRNVDYGSMSPLFLSLVKEIKAWIALLETAYHLERCRFTETILSARKLKVHIVVSSTTTLQLWFRQMLDRFLAIMPIYFDRINAFASPLYGFDTMHLSEMSRIHDSYDSLVLDFLRRHESKGGPSMAIGIVMDAVRTNNLNFARGFILASNESSAKLLTPMEKDRREWHAVYMRTTVHGVPSSSPLSRSPSHGGGGISTLMRRGRGSFLTSSKKELLSSSEDDFSMSLTNIIRVASSHDSTSTSKQAHQVNMNVMEYAPETGPCSWPHTEWNSLVELIKDEFALSSPSQQDGSISGEAVTYRQPESKAAEKSSSLIAHGYEAPFVPSPPPPTSTCSFHTIRLSDCLWMVAILKCEEDGKWHLRRARGHNDEEIRAFLNEMSLKLRVSCLFDKKSVESVKKTPRDLQHALPGHDLVRVWQEWDETNTQGFLRELKRSFRLRPQSPYMESLRRRGTPRSLRKRQRTVSHSDSAIAFFVGADIPL